MCPRGKDDLWTDKAGKSSSYKDSSSEETRSPSITTFFLLNSTLGAKTLFGREFGATTFKSALGIEPPFASETNSFLGFTFPTTTIVEDEGDGFPFTMGRSGRSEVSRYLISLIN